MKVPRSAPVYLMLLSSQAGALFAQECFLVRPAKGLRSAQEF
jgi:hypothetical protein